MITVNTQRVAHHAIGPWPTDPLSGPAGRVTGTGLLGSMSWRHARAEWETARGQVGRRNTLGLTRAQAEAAVTLAFVSRVAGHALTCRRCNTTGTLDTVTPGQWLIWALGRKAATRAVLAPVLAEQRGRRVVPPLPGGEKVPENRLRAAVSRPAVQPR